MSKHLEPSAEAARKDETCAIEYWGINNALGQIRRKCRRALKKAVELMPTVYDHEKYYIRAISLLAEQGKGWPVWIAEKINPGLNKK